MIAYDRNALHAALDCVLDRKALHCALDRVLDRKALHCALDTTEFKEQEHPRKNDGKFAKTTGSSSGAGEMPKGMEHVTKGAHKTVASFAYAMLAEGKYSDANIAKASQALFGSKTSQASISWYKAQAKKKTPEGQKANAAKAAGVAKNSDVIAQAIIKPAPVAAVNVLISEGEAATGKTMYASCTDKDGKKVFCKVPNVPDGLDNAAALSKLLSKQGLTVNFAGVFSTLKPEPPGGYTNIALSPDDVQNAKDAAYAKSEETAKANGIVTELEEALSPEMLTAIKAYTNGSYGALNRGLRQGLPMSLAQATLASHLDLALSKAKMAKDTFVYRGVGDAASKFFGPKPTVGTVIIDNGYMSTAKTADKAWKGAKCRIHVPKGARALDVVPLSLHPKEAEVVLPRGSMFKIVGISADGWVELEYVAKPK